MATNQKVEGSNPSGDAIKKGKERLSMIGKHIYVKNWISYSQIKDYKECPFDDYHEDALIKELIEKNYIICGDTHQCSEYNTIPVFNDGYLMLSMRRWQEIMTEA